MAGEKLRVLITNNRLDLRGGAEVFVRDLARGLERRGHAAMVFSCNLAEGPRFMEQDPVPVTTDPAGLRFKPDIIHGQHHMDTMAAVLSLPGVPAVYHCHGAVWRETQPIHPRIYRYLAMSPTLARRLMIESNLDESRVEVLLNPVDLLRFSRVRPPAPKCARALFYNLVHQPGSPTVAEIRAASEACGLDLDLLRHLPGGRLDEPERMLLDYDLVFASGKSAIDALACGCAVVALGRTSCGELVRPENFARYRAANFSIPVNSPPPDARAIAEQIRLYSPEETARVTEMLRREADIEPFLDRLESIYGSVIEEHRARQPDPEEEQRAAGHYLRRIVPLIKAIDQLQMRAAGLPYSLAAAWLDLSAQIDSLKARLDEIY